MWIETHRDASDSLGPKAQLQSAKLLPRGFKHPLKMLGKERGSNAQSEVRHVVQQREEVDDDFRVRRERLDTQHANHPIAPIPHRFSISSYARPSTDSPVQIDDLRRVLKVNDLEEMVQWDGGGWDGTSQLEGCLLSVELRR